MLKSTLSCCLIALVILTGCAPAYNRSTVVERPSQQIKEVLIVIEEPAFSAPGREKDGILKIDSASQSALDRYRFGFYRTVRRDFVRVMSDNGISSKLVFISPVSSMNPHPLNMLPQEERTRWPYTLWIRHVKGMSQCRYSGCEAFFQLEAKLLDTGSTRMLWNAQEAGATYYGEKVWSDGRMYKYLLDRLSTDGMITLQGTEPIIKVEATANR